MDQRGRCQPTARSSPFKAHGELEDSRRQERLTKCLFLETDIGSVCL